MASREEREKVAAARETLDTLMEMSNLLNTGLDSESLSICVKLIEAGVNPEALALVIKELRREGAAIQNMAFGVGGHYRCFVWAQMYAFYKAEEGGGN
eukprot:gene12845-3591_t